MARRDRFAARRVHPLAPVVAVVASGMAVVAFSAPSGAAVATVSGGAFGELVDATITDLGNVNSGPMPTVTLPPTGGSFTQSAPSASAGPNGLFLTAGALNVSTQGTTGASGSVTSGASVLAVNVLQTLEAAGVASTCRAAESGTTATTTITDGTLIQNATTTVDLPTNPAPNTTYQGVNDGEGGTGDEFTVILNQQTTAGGVLTVNAVNFILRGPTATGNVILGQSRCGVSATAATTTTTGTGATTTTRAVTATTRRPGTGTGTGTTDTSGTAELARTGWEAPLLPGLALVTLALAASRRARRRSGP